VGIGNVVAVVLMVRKARRSARWVGVQWSRSACAPSRGGGWMAPMSGSSSLDFIASERRSVGAPERE